MKPSLLRSFVWKRTHTIIAAVTAALLAMAGVGVAVATRDQPSPVTAPAGISPTPAPTPKAAPKPAPKPAPPAKPKPAVKRVDALTGGRPSGNDVIAAKIENIPAARPQVGLASADVVFAEEVEGRQTRLVAVYHSRFPKRIGPVRSARNTDVELLAMFGKPALVYSGANGRVQRNIDSSDLKAVPRSTRDSRRVAPHNVFVDLAGIARAVNTPTPDSIGWTFAGSDPRWSKARRDGNVSGRVGGDRFGFEYRGGRYIVRWQGRTYADGDSGAKATADNVIVLSVNNVADGNRDVNGAASVKSETVGSGKVSIHRGGRTLSGTWKRPKQHGPMRLVDGSGKDIPLKPGKTWVLLSG